MIADEFDGKRLNSPNDLIHRSDDTLYFTDPPLGLPEVYSDPTKELPFSGVFMVGKDGQEKTRSEGPCGTKRSCILARKNTFCTLTTGKRIKK